MKPCYYCGAGNGDCKAMTKHLKEKVSNGVRSFDTKAKIALLFSCLLLLSGCSNDSTLNYVCGDKIQGDMYNCNILNEEGFRVSFTSCDQVTSEQVCLDELIGREWSEYDCVQEPTQFVPNIEGILVCEEK